MCVVPAQGWCGAAKNQAHGIESRRVVVGCGGGASRTRALYFSAGGYMLPYFAAQRRSPVLVSLRVLDNSAQVARPQ